MAKTAASVRAALAKAGGEGKGRGSGYGASARAKAVAFARARLGEGISLVAAAHERVIGAPTLQRWLDAHEQLPAFAQIKVEQVGAMGFTLVSPTGWRVEGLDLETLRALVGERS